MADRMQIGLFGLNQLTAPDELRAVAALAEERGFESVWMGEHMVYPTAPGQGLASATEPILDPLVALSFVAASTTRLVLGSGILVLPQRHPVALAKELASLDRLSGGRLVVGVGVGYLSAELAALGVDPESRGAKADEALEVMRELWRSPAPAFAGRWTSFADVDAHPRPISPGGPPIVVGGHGDAAYRRVARYGQGWYGFRVSPASVSHAVAQISALRARDGGGADLHISVTPDRDLDLVSIHDYRAAGVDRLIWWPSERDDFNAWTRSIERLTATGWWGAAAWGAEQKHHQVRG